MEAAILKAVDRPIGKRPSKQPPLSDLIQDYLDQKVQSREWRTVPGTDQTGKFGGFLRIVDDLPAAAITVAEDSLEIMRWVPAHKAALR